MVVDAGSFIFQFNTERCKRCGICSHFCPRRVIATGDDGYPYARRPEKCTRCFLCFHRCPDFAVEVKDVDTDAISAG